MKHLLGSTALMVGIVLSSIDALSIPSALRFQSFAPKKPLEVVPKARSFLSNALKDLKPFGNPSFCHGLDCPAYKVLNKTENYELREYMASNWVTTNHLNMDYDAAESVMFMRLFDYIEGQNEKKEKIAMTAPVITRVVPGQGPACKNNFTMSFFMAPKVKDPPVPTEKTVFLSSLPEQKVYVSYFGGREHEKDWISHAEKLAGYLTKDKKKFDSSFFYTAGYDSPFRLLFRHNEIWFMAE